MILVIKTNSNPLHDLEFVKPVENIIKKSFKTIHYSKLNKKIIDSSKKIIITGTSLKDNQYIKDLNKFDFIKNYEKPILGICSGIQIISIIYGGKLKLDKGKEIGYYKEFFKKDFLSINGEQELYHLHTNYVTLPKDFEKFTKSKIPEAIKHKTKPTYGVLFHPEVRNKKIIEEFIYNNH